MMTVSVSQRRTFALTLLFCLTAPVCLTALGCRALSRSDDSHSHASQARWSFVKFNMAALSGHGSEAAAICGLEDCAAPCDTYSACETSRALALLAKSNSDLDQLIRCRPAPVLDEIEGPWKGINKGIGTALLGVTQDTKVFQACSRGCDQAGCGYNIKVQQVSLCDLDLIGFRPETDRDTGRATTMGNFVIRPVKDDRAPMILDYTAAENRTLDPSRRLIDELVMIEPNLILGRAHVKVGTLQVPIAYFVLYRD